MKRLDLMLNQRENYMCERVDGDFIYYEDAAAELAKRDAIIERQAEEIRMLRKVAESAREAIIYEDGTGAAAESLYHWVKDLAEFDRKKEQEKQ